MLSTKYNPAEVEDKWYAYWMEHGFFRSDPDPAKEPYTVVIPPPNVTGVLHMGHMLNNTIQDILIRKARMEGKAALWVPGTDHASIATEARVVAMLREKGISKSDLTREEFLNYAWEWRAKYGGIILEQLKKLGASCDWSRTRFTMDPEYYKAVIDVFIDLYKKGYIYRGVRMVNWDPAGKTALSDDEVNYKDVPSRMVYIRYQIEGTTDEYVTIATVRPETIMADAAICVNPADERYRHLKGRRAIIPLINRAIPIIEDDYVAMDFGTGCLKVTPAHDMNDYEIGIRHGLPVLDIISDDGTLNEKALRYVGEDRFIARKKIIKDLEAAGNLVKVEEYTSHVGFSERTDAVIEPKLSMQWFLKMDTITKPALEKVMDDTIQLIPPKFKNTYRHWMENVRDWCISRQLWWGHRIPAWYDEQGRVVVAESHELALEEYKKKFPDSQTTTLTQDPDVLDTWFSSWLWPIAVFDPTVFRDGSKGNADLNYYYPTHDLVTAPEILFFWVARMIIAGYEYRGDRPFRHVYLTGIVRDKLGRKMSKSLGNSPDPLDLIRQYGADAMRTGMLFSSPAGNDLLYDEKLIEQGRNFANKIWNAFRLVQGWTPVEKETPAECQLAIDWFESALNRGLTELHDAFEKFRMSDALMIAYKLVWDDFCSWYLELVKPEFGSPIDATTYRKTKEYFNVLLRVLHPFMPFITEELWHALEEREDCIIVAPWPQPASTDPELLRAIEHGFAAISEVRNIRSTKGLSPKDTLAVWSVDLTKSWKRVEPAICKLGNVTLHEGNAPEGAVSFRIEGTEFFIPLDDKIDVEREKESLEKERVYLEGFLASVEKKLANEKFVASAKPEIVANERQKKSDAEAKLALVRARLERL